MTIKKLNSKFCETAKPCDGLEFEAFRDEGTSGLEFRVSKSGAKSWIFRYRRKSDGERRVLTMGRFPEIKLAEARDLVDAYKVAIKNGGDPASQAQIAKKAETFADVAAEWETAYAAKQTARSLANDKLRLTAHVLPVLGKMKAREITKADIKGLIRVINEKPDGRVRKGRDNDEATEDAGEPIEMVERTRAVFALVRKIMRWAIREDVGALTIDPTLGVTVPKAAEPRERNLSADEIHDIWRWLDTATDRTNKKRGSDDKTPYMSRGTALAALLSLTTGQRIGECTGIHIAELDLSDVAPVWTIPKTRTKNKRVHRVPLSPLAVRIIKDARERAPDSPFLFPSPPADKLTKRAMTREATGKGAIDAHAAARALARSRKLIDVEEFTLHDLRRTAATRMAEIGIDDRTISRVLNHTVKGEHAITGGTYVQYPYDKEKREALNAWAARLERIIAGQDAKHNVVALGSKAGDQKSVPA